MFNKFKVCINLLVFFVVSFLYCSGTLAETAFGIAKQSIVENVLIKKITDIEFNPYESVKIPLRVPAHYYKKKPAQFQVQGVPDYTFTVSVPMNDLFVLNQSNNRLKFERFRVFPDETIKIEKTGSRLFSVTTQKKSKNNVSFDGFYRGRYTIEVIY